MAALIIEGKNTAKLELLATLAKELGFKVKQEGDRTETAVESRLRKGFKEAKEIQAGKLKGADAYKFLNDL